MVVASAYPTHTRFEDGISPAYVVLRLARHLEAGDHFGRRFRRLGDFCLGKSHFLLAMGQSSALVPLVSLLGTSPSWSLEIQSPRIERDDPASTLLAWN